MFGPRHVLLYAAAAMISCCSAALPPFAVLPDVPQFVEDNAVHANLKEFVKLWKETLAFDGQGDAPVVRINFEPKTIVAPDDFQMRNIVAQHRRNPLLLKDPRFAELRREFLLDHILLDPVELNSTDLQSEEGLRMMTFSGKDLIFKIVQDKGLVAGDVRVLSAMSLPDATMMLATDGVLFDAKQRVNRALNFETRTADLDTPLGPPLDIDGASPSSTRDNLAAGLPTFPEVGVVNAVLGSRVAQPPAPLTSEQFAAFQAELAKDNFAAGLPTFPEVGVVNAVLGSRVAQPPAPPTPEQLAAFQAELAKAAKNISPPALPPGAIVRAPAAPLAQPPAGQPSINNTEEAADVSSSSNPKATGKVRKQRKPQGPSSQK